MSPDAAFRGGGEPRRGHLVFVRAGGRGLTVILVAQTALAKECGESLI
jgi:hypothetical protein